MTAEPFWTHSLDEDPLDCWGCIMDTVNAPDEPMGPHEPEPSGETDEQGAPLCYCGHTIVRQWP